MTKRSYRFIRFLDELGIEDVPAVGGKNASLGEMYRDLRPGGYWSRMDSPLPPTPIV